MSVRKTEEFLLDVERQFEWYGRNATWNVAQRYLDAMEATTLLLGRHPRLGPRGGFKQPGLRDWRFFVVFRPFNQHLVFYELAGDDVVIRRTLHDHRNLPRRLVEPPGPG